MGRKPLGTSEKRTEAIKVLFTPGEFDAIQGVAKKMGYTELAGFCRQVLLTFVQDVRMDSYYLKLTRQEYVQLLAAARVAGKEPGDLVKKYAELAKAWHLHRVDDVLKYADFRIEAVEELERDYASKTCMHTKYKYQIAQTNRRMCDYKRERKKVLREMIRQIASEPLPNPPSFKELF